MTKQHLAVMLRIGKRDNDLFALFPEEPANWSGTLCACYCLVGQHTGAAYHFCIENSKPAIGPDAERILEALKRIGYDNFKVIKRTSHTMHTIRRQAYHNTSEEI